METEFKYLKQDLKDYALHIKSEAILEIAYQLKRIADTLDRKK